METLTKHRYKERLDTQKDTTELMLEHLNISEASYFELLFELGYQLSRSMFDEEDVLEELMQNPKLEYWSWFKMQWYIEEGNFWAANKWMILENPKYFRSPKMADPNKAFKAAWYNDMRIWSRSEGLRKSLHYHIIQVDPFKDINPKNQEPCQKK